MARAASGQPVSASLFSPGASAPRLRAWIAYFLRGFWLRPAGKLRQRREWQAVRPLILPEMASNDSAPADRRTGRHEKGGVVAASRGNRHYWWADDFSHAGDPQVFDVAGLRARGHIIGQATGRHPAWFIRMGSEAWVLRHYFRGGLVGRLIHDGYICLFRSQSRCWREFSLLREMRRIGLPVPRALGVQLVRRGFVGRGDLLMERLPGCQSLAEHLAEGKRPAAKTWTAIGATLARFHAAGVDHADLNCRNILIDARGEIWLVDFDRGRLRVPGPWRMRNLARLKRSLLKEAGQASEGVGWDPAGWTLLLLGYRRAG